MANRIKIKRKTTPGAPNIGDLVDGELCLVVPDKTIYHRVDSSNMITYLQSTNYASPTVGGVIKMRVDGDDVYITNDGTDA